MTIWQALEATWPAAEVTRVGPWTLRRGEGGGKRVSATEARAPWEPGDIPRAEAAMAALGQGIEARLRRALDVPSDEIEAVLAQHCHDDRFDCASLRRIADANRGWGTQQGSAHAELAERFLAADGAGRVGMVRELAGIALTAKGEALLPVVLALRQWGEDWGHGTQDVMLADQRDGKPVRPIRVLAEDGRELELHDLMWIDRISGASVDRAKPQ